MIVNLLAASIVAAALALAFKKARVPLAALAITGFAIVAYQVYTPGAPTVTTARAAHNDVELVDVTFTSDPTGADVLIGQYKVGTTPYTTERAVGEPLEYTIRMESPYEEYDLYEPFTGTVTPQEDVAIDVWLDRTTAEEQQAQREAYAENRAEAEEQRMREELRSSPWRLVRRTDEITDEDSSYIITYATDTPSILEEDAYLMIRCDHDDPTASDGIALIIFADDYLSNDDIALDWRFDDNPAVQRQRWRNSTDGTAVYNLSYKTMFLTQMFGANELTVRLYDFRGSSLDYAFDVDGARAALTLLGCYRGSAL